MVFFLIYLGTFEQAVYSQFKLDTGGNLVGKEEIKYSTHEDLIKEYKNLPTIMKWKSGDKVII
jgi:hypothetical protein